MHITHTYTVHLHAYTTDMLPHKYPHIPGAHMTGEAQNCIPEVNLAEEQTHKTKRLIASGGFILQFPNAKRIPFFSLQVQNLQTACLAPRLPLRAVACLQHPKL